MKVLELRHFNAEGKLLFEHYNILNLLHNDGEEYLLRAAFTGGRVSDVIPDNYYLGLDNRQAIDITDTMDDLIGEPSAGGYQRQAVASSGDFSINFEDDHFIATSPIVAFRATTGDWGPVSNLFLTNASDNSGYLISTAVLPSPITVDSGNTVTMRIGMKLVEC